MPAAPVVSATSSGEGVSADGASNVSNTRQTSAAIYTPASSRNYAAHTTDARLSYVGRDVRRVVVLVSAATALELALWLAFNHTGLGAAVYRLIKI